jgi:hypothetical protein
MDNDELLKCRQKSHGHFSSNCETSILLKNAMKSGVNYANLSPVHKESLDSIVGKISRVVNGNCNFLDHWVDIQGYAKLCEKYIVKHNKK